MQQAIQQANQLMSSGEADKAKSLLLATLESSTDKATYADAVAIFMAGNMYSEARSVFELYERRTGTSLGGASDFSLEDIGQKLISRESDQGDGQWFAAKTKIMHGKDRVTGLGIFADHLVVKRGSTERSYAWADIIKAGLTNTSYKRGINSYRISLSTHDDQIRFRLCPNVPDNFENEGNILPALKKHLAFHETNTGNRNFWMFAGVGLLLLFILQLLRGNV